MRNFIYIFATKSPAEIRAQRMKDDGFENVKGPEETKYVRFETYSPLQKQTATVFEEGRSVYLVSGKR